MQCSTLTLIRMREFFNDSYGNCDEYGEVAVDHDAQGFDSIRKRLLGVLPRFHGVRRLTFVILGWRAWMLPTQSCLVSLHGVMPDPHSLKCEM